MRIGKVTLSLILGLVLILSVALPIGLLSTSPSYAFSGSGSGTLGSPYVITNVSQLQEMNNNLTAYYILGNDIDASSTSAWNSGLGFLPIGNMSNEFTGNFNGKGYNITGLVVNRVTDFSGLFGYVDLGTISNISLISGNISGGWAVGGLVGWLELSTISNSCSTGNISANSIVGGLVGELSGSTITNSYSTANITQIGTEGAGGLVGETDSGFVTNSYSTGNVIGVGSLVGGLVGGTFSGAAATNSYWNTVTSGQATSAIGIGKNTTQMQTKTTYLCGWSFYTCSNVGIWGINSSSNSGYPFLIQQGYSNNASPGLIYAAGTNGTLSGSTFQIVSCGGNGTVVTAVPNTSYEFSGWSDGLTSNPRQDLNVSSDHCVTANFIPIPPPSSFVSSTYSNTSISLSWIKATNTSTTLIRRKTTGYPTNVTDGVLVYNSSGTYCSDSGLIPSTHYYYSAWSYSNLISNYSSPTYSDNYTMVNLVYTASQNGTLKVYSPTGYSLGYFTTYYSCWYYNDSSGYQIQAIPNDACHYFLNWSDGSTDNIRTDIGLTSNLSLSSNIPPYYSNVTFYVETTGGSIVGVTSQNVSCGTYSTYVSAVPDPLCNFSFWAYKEGGTGTLLSTNISVQGLPYGAPITLAADFSPASYINLNYSNTSGGYLTGNVSQVVPLGDNGTAVTAVPNSCYHFVNWSDGSVQNPRQDLVVTSDIYAIANFAPITYTLATGAVYGSILTPWQPGAFTYNCGQNVTLIASPANSYCTFVNWTGSTGTIGNTSSASTYIIMSGSYSIQANFNYTGPTPTSVPTVSPSQNIITTNLSSFGITDVKVFRNFLVTGDQVFLVYYRVVNNPTPTFSSTNYLNLDIYSNGILKARSKVYFWGYAPASIYLSPTSSLIWGSTYTVELEGIPGMWTTLPTPGTYNLSSSDWLGTDMNQLDNWILTTAQSIDTQNGNSQYLVTYVAGYNEILSNAGCSIFSTAITSLAQARTNLCSISASSINQNSTASENLSRAGQTALTNNFGTTVMTSFNNLGADMGVSGSVLAGLFWFVLMLLVAGIGTAASRNSVVGVIISLPILFIGNYLGVVSLSLMGVIGTLCIIYLLRQLWLVGQ